MSAIDSSSIGICDICGALIWWDRIEKHAEWHEGASTRESPHV